MPQKFLPNFFLFNLVYAALAILLILHLIRAQTVSTTSLHDWILQGHVANTFNLTRLAQCLMMCTETWNCYSLNFYPSKGVCELNNALNASHPADLQHHPNGVYLLNLYRRMPCEDSICAAGGQSKRCFYQYDRGIAKECIDCSTPFGLGDRTLPDSSFKASSSYHEGQDSSPLARLGIRSNFVTRCPNQWIQVDLLRVVFVTKIATQGSYTFNQKYVKTYYIDKGFDGKNWQHYKEDGVRRLFVGNTDGSTVVSNAFKEKMSTRFVRLLCQSSNDLFALRMELYGCKLP